MAHLERRGKRWRVRWRDGGRGSVQRVQYFPTRPEAEKHQREVEAKLAAARPLRPMRTIAWPVLVARFQASRSEATEQHRHDVGAMLVALAEARDWTTSTDVIPGTVEGLGTYQRRMLKAFLRYVERLDQRVDRRVYELLAPPPTRRTPSVLLTERRVAALIAEAGKWHPADGAIAHLISTYGHRAQSLVGLDGGAVALGRRSHITLPLKSGDLHRHPLLPVSVEILRPLKPRRGRPLFVGHLGRPWVDGREFAGWWGHCIAKPGEGVLDLRRYAITRMLAPGTDAKTVASITGHRTPSLLLNTYARTTEQRQGEALAAIGRRGAPRCSPK